MHYEVGLCLVSGLRPLVCECVLKCSLLMTMTLLGTETHNTGWELWFGLK